jgi:metal-sulfur cluster biosynthetic enzyme
MSDASILEALKDVIVPEIGLNIVDLGLVYDADWTAQGIVVAMTVTTPTCPIGDLLVAEAESVLRRHFPETPSIRVDLLWDPPWSPDRISEHGRQVLGWSDSDEVPIDGWIH